VRSFAAAAVILALLAGCGSGGTSPERVVRAWSKALNAGDNDAAADLFAKNAEVVQGSVVTRLRTHADAVAWNTDLPCSGKIVSLSAHGPVVRATFVLGDRKSSPCDGPGKRAAAVFRIRGGKIVLWHQVPAGGPSTSTVPAV
jgi:limonene-1,2-epoxide hydrolase